MITFDFTKTPITQVADTIIINAANKSASDIHLDPRESGLMIRYRIDGDLVDYAFVPKLYERNLITRLKLLANMNITETRLPQDGAIKGKFGGLTLDMRVSSLPTNEGEKIVIRILDYTMSLSGIETLGFNEENFEKLKRMIAVPNGIILVTGATGSGKSTTVYSILQVLNKEETNIITVEDPIEMNIEGMNQVQVNSDIGLNFATVLRSILRQDPNIILIGEIRDSETAQIAVRASITGHLVLSTIHTNNSLSTIERLLDMNVERYLLSSAFTGIISQKLAKRICPKCKINRPTTLYEQKVFKLALNKDILQIDDANHKGCPNCNKGYKGRIAIQEVLEINEDIRNKINNPKVNREDLRNLVYGGNHVITMLQDGLRKVLDGYTSFEEIYRIIEIDNDIEDSYHEEIPKNLSLAELDDFLSSRKQEIEDMKNLAAKNKKVDAPVNNSNSVKEIKKANATVATVKSVLPSLPDKPSIIPNPNLDKIRSQSGGQIKNVTQSSSNPSAIQNTRSYVKSDGNIIKNPNLNKAQVINNSQNEAMHMNENTNVHSQSAVNNAKDTKLHDTVKMRGIINPNVINNNSQLDLNGSLKQNPKQQVILPRGGVSPNVSDSLINRETVKKNDENLIEERKKEKSQIIKIPEGINFDLNSNVSSKQKNESQQVLSQQGKVSNNASSLNRTNYIKNNNIVRIPEIVDVDFKLQNVGATPITMDSNVALNSSVNSKQVSSGQVDFSRNSVLPNIGSNSINDTVANTNNRENVINNVPLMPKIN